jgi:hypothetical protein
LSYSIVQSEVISMTEIRSNQPMNFKDRFTQAAQDKHITAKEAKELNAHIAQMKIPDADKKALTEMVGKLEDATNGKFLFFKWTSGINSKEKAGLESLAKSNGMANQLLMFYNEAITQHSTLDESLTKSPSQNSAYTGNASPTSAQMDPKGVQFNRPTSNRPAANAPTGNAPVDNTRPVDNTPMGDMETELYEAIKSYPGNKATDAEAKEIARTLNEAAKSMGFSAENTRKMLAVFAHESGGFDPDARSHTGAGGLGQLTGVAIEDMDRLSKNGGPYAGIRDKLVRPGGDRTDIASNIWTSVAYMDHLMKEIDSPDISNAFVAYNTGVGGYRALMSMSTSQADAYLERATGVSGKGNEARSYAGLVTSAYNRMFG